MADDENILKENQHCFSNFIVEGTTSVVYLQSIKIHADSGKREILPVNLLKMADVA